MNIDELLDLMDEAMEEAINVPFSGGRRVVDVEKLREMMDDIRLNLPTEIRQAKAIVQDRMEIISTAKKEAETILKRAEERARSMMMQEGVVKAAEAYAVDISAKARSEAQEVRAKVDSYCDSVLRQTEEQLVRNASEVKKLRMEFRQSGRNQGVARVTPRPQGPQV